MNFIKDKIEKFVNLSALDNIISNYPKTIGVVCSLDLCPNDNNRFIGRIVLKYNTQKPLQLNERVEFLVTKIQHKTLIKDNSQLFLIDPFFVRKYITNPTIECIVETYNPKTNSIQYSTMMLRYKQFMKRRLLEKTGTWPYRMVMAIENFINMRKQGRYKAINSTVKNYLVPQHQLESYIGKRSTIIRDINNEWKTLVNEDNEERIYKMSLKPPSIL